VVTDAIEVVRTCEGCQFYARKTHLPAHALQTIPITWPFAVWGLDLVGPLKKLPGGFTHLLVAIDKFSKWIEGRPIGKIKSEQAALFFTDIVHRFGVLNSIITDNGTQFTGKNFLEFCDDYHIRVDWALLGNSGKPVTLETSSLTKFSKYVFSGAGDAQFSETWNLRSHEFANVQNSGILIR
jgi:hypothetical protein